MKIKDLMTLDLFKKCKLLTGDIGLDNIVNSAMVLEAIDIENWSKKNQLILTSFYAFKNVKEHDRIVFFKKMSELGVSGLIVKMDRLIVMIPEWLIDLCFKYDIPLIKAPADISYEKIMLTIYEPILNQQEHLLRTYYDVRQKFTKIERNLRSFDQIMESFYQIIKLPCALKSNDLKIDIHCGKNFNDYIITKEKHFKSTEFTKNIYKQLTLFSQKKNQTITALSTQLQSNFTHQLDLTIYQENKQVMKQADLMIVENAIDLIHEQLQMDYMLKKDRYTRMNNLADAILQNTPGNMDQLNSLLDEANMNNYKYYQGVALSKRQEENQIEEKVLNKKIRSLRPYAIYFDHYNYTVVLFNLKTEQEKITKEELEDLLADDKKLSNEVLISPSQLKQKHNLKEILFECLDTIRFNKYFYIACVTSIDDLGIFRFFMKDDKFKQIDTIIPDKLVDLQQNNERLFATLVTFFNHNRNYKKTAESLFLDPKTIRYRLNKIETQLGLDLTNPVQMVNYELGTYLLAMRGRIPDERNN